MVEVFFMFAQVAELAVFVGEEELLNNLAAKSSGSCTQKNIEEMNNNRIQDELIIDIAKRYRLYDSKLNVLLSLVSKIRS